MLTCSMQYCHRFLLSTVNTIKMFWTIQCCVTQKKVAINQFSLYKHCYWMSIHPIALINFAITCPRLYLPNSLIHCCALCVNKGYMGLCVCFVLLIVQIQ